MADLETGAKWWLRYVVVPLVGGGGIIALTVAILQKRSAPPAPVVAAAPSLPSAEVLREQTMRSPDKVTFENSQYSMAINTAADGIGIDVDVKGPHGFRDQWTISLPGRHELKHGEKRYFVDIVSMNSSDHSIRVAITRELD